MLLLSTVAHDKREGQTPHICNKDKGLRAGTRRVVPSAGHRWVAPASTAERRSWVAPAHEGTDVCDAKGKGVQVSDGDGSPHRDNDNVQTCDPATEYSEPSTGSEIVSVEQKKRKVAGEDGSAGSVVIDTWHSLFEGAKAWSFVCPYSDHLPIMITPEVVRRAHRRSRFCFDNMWLKEIACREIVEHSWDKTLGLDVLTRITVCSHDIWRWGRVYNKDFLRKIDSTKSKLESLRMRRDPVGIADYARTEKELIGVAVEDSSSPNGVRLLIQDYPYAVDVLEIWSSIKTWVQDYCKIYYKSDDVVQKDTEL
nr:probable linoleate 9S-lipoxygenase 5 [Ipomoea batatas]